MGQAAENTMKVLNLADAEPLVFTPRDVYLGYAKLGTTIDMETYENISIGTRLIYGKVDRYTILSFFMFDDRLSVELLRGDGQISWDYVSSAVNNVHP